ncbi:MAG TPA: hypothetical protein P5526_05885 [Anaerolineae bacterium]|nr:hypothetical protein [Anaerolineae bacterium]MCB9107143.1 hypothetical protein [Anaerolineales bacterium]HRV91672.1 hypothetical protein [Anaerolineae bacterium]
MTLAVLFGLRASVDALAVVIGVMLGVTASVPTTFLLTYLLVRRENSSGVTTPNQQAAVHPPIVVINSSDKPAIAGPPGLPPGPPNQGRSWTVIGDIETD